jgi:rod shape-determining protein MreC
MAVTRTQKEIQQRAPLWLAVLLIINLGLMSWKAKDQRTQQSKLFTWTQTIFGPLQIGVSRAEGVSFGFFRYLFNLRHAASENEQLKERVSQLEIELREANTAKLENDRLRALLDLKDKSSYKPIPARVIARDPSIWFKSVIIDKGSTSGIDKNMPVVTPEGLIGRVIAVAPFTAQVLLITDEKAGTGAVVGQLDKSNALGVIQGRGKDGLLEMRYVAGTEKVNVGDRISTTGQDLIYPANLTIGDIVEVKTASSTEAHFILVKPSARLEALKDVAVLQYRPPEAETSFDQPKEPPKGSKK